MWQIICHWRITGRFSFFSHRHFGKFMGHAIRCSSAQTAHKMTANDDDDDDAEEETHSLRLSSHSSSIFRSHHNSWFGFHHLWMQCLAVCSRPLFSLFRSLCLFASLANWRSVCSTDIYLLLEIRWDVQKVHFSKLLLFVSAPSAAVMPFTHTHTHIQTHSRFA